jgi:hypothetical protein
MPRTPSSATSAARLIKPYTKDTKSAKKDRAEGRTRAYAHWANYATQSLEPIREADLWYPCPGSFNSGKCKEILEWKVVVGSTLEACLNGRVGTFHAWVRAVILLFDRLITFVSFSIPVPDSWGRVLWPHG